MNKLKHAWGRRVALALMCAFLASGETPARSGELIGGTNTYMSESRSWPTGVFSGYYIYDSAGETIWQTGPLADGPVECHGAGFWTPHEISGEGICIFGEAPNQWTVTHELTPGRNEWEDIDKNRFHRNGTWRVIHATGTYAGMSGDGTFVSNELADGRKTTWFEGVVAFAN